MAEPITLQTLLTYLTLISVPVGVIYHIMTLRNTRKNQQLQLETRQAQLFMQTYRETSTPEMQTRAFEILAREWTDIADYTEKYVKDPKEYGEWVSFMLHMNGIGILLKEKYIDSELWYKMDQDGMAPFMWWFKFEPIIMWMREQMNNPALMKYFEYYVEEMIRIRKLNGLPSKWSTEQGTFLNE